MSEYLNLILGIIIVILGIIMLVVPKKSVSKDDKITKKTNASGVLVIICGIVLIVVGVMQVM